MGGWLEPNERFSSLVSDPTTRKAFIDHVVTFLQLHHFDGLDIAWFYPVCLNGVCSKNLTSERDNFSLLLLELKSAFDQLDPRLILTVVIPGDNQIIDNAYDIKSLMQLDYISVMTFDYVALSSGKTGHHASLYGQPGETNNVVRCLQIFSKQTSHDDLFLLEFNYNAPA